MSIALFPRHAKRKCRIILSTVASLTLPYSTTMSHKRHDYKGKKYIKLKKNILIFYTTFVKNISYSKRHRGLQVKYPLFLSYFSKTFNCRNLVDKHWNTKFHENASSRSRVVPYKGQAGRQTWRSKQSLFTMWKGRLKVIKYTVYSKWPLILKNTKITYKVEIHNMITTFKWLAQ